MTYHNLSREKFPIWCNPMDYSREGNGNPLQYSCLGDPVDRGAWWAAVHGVAQSQTWLKWLSSSSSMNYSTTGLLSLPLYPAVCSNSCPLNWQYYLTISFSAMPFSFCLQTSQHQGLFQWVSSSNQMAKYWSFSFNISPTNEYSG